VNELDTREQMTFLLPMINFETELPELSIKPDLRMRPLTREEKQSLIRRIGPIEVTYPKLEKYCLEAKAKNIRPAMKKAYPIISALRLLKSNLVGINSILLGEASKTWMVYRYPGSMEADTSSRRIYKGIYVLKESEKADFLSLGNKIGKMILDKKLRFALGRLNMAYSSKWLDTKLLDYMIALESLYLPGESEKQFRLCCYLTSTLSPVLDESTEEIWNFIHKAYGLRSQIVHGSGSLSPRVKIGKGEDVVEVSIEDFVDKIEEYTRQSIREFIRRGKKVKEIQSNIKAKVIKDIGMEYIHQQG